ncbi:hypothetical protein PRZ48_003710 [Zasmidium cellare]|uniref:Ribosomal protein S12 n=1 Tax=Zasmidium cellare TaxID=395010 RepID=A0ABR0EWD9_ZASCE|nr:hypothetical protein PRZ48_003710 [Zasmidium cellare]
MYRTALQQLNLVAKTSKWENLYSPPVTPTPRISKHMRFPSQTQRVLPLRACKLRASREKGKKNKGRCLVVIRRYKPGAAKNRIDPCCGGTRSQGRRESKSDVQGLKAFDGFEY